MKQAEEALAKRGFILRWKVRVKTNSGFFGDMVSRLIAGDAVPAAKAIEKQCGPKKRLQKTGKPNDAEPETLEAAPEQAAVQGPEEGADEPQPVTALNMRDAASYLGISTAGIYDLVKRGRLPAHGKIGARWFKTEELDRYRQDRKKRSRNKNP
jgi:excisionase family DNA binding protein